MRILLIFLFTALATAADGPIPGKTWEGTDPTVEGWPADRLEAVRREFETGPPAAFFVGLHGKALIQWGDVDKPRNLRSIRKALVGALVGQEIAANRLSLSDTLGKLGIEEKTPLTEGERRATLADLLSSRSGVYLPAAYELPSNAARRPVRGSHEPGAFYYYNNWDFNVLGTIVERSAKDKLFTVFQNRVAQPLGMEDFRPEHTTLRKEDLSDHPAHLFALSPRDLARFALLYLREGKWGSREIVPASWVRESIKMRSETDPGREWFGFLWWIYPGSQGRPTVYTARGAGGQYAMMIPELDMVAVFSQEPPLGSLPPDLSKLPEGRAWRLMRALMAARAPVSR